MAADSTEINPDVLDRARRLAAESHCSVNKILQRALDEIDRRTPGRKSIIGLFADDPNLADELLDDVYRTREHARLRQPGDR